MPTVTLAGAPWQSYQPAGSIHYPFCPGCGHPAILDQLNAALVKLQLDPHKVVIVTDIGCVGMADQYFATHAFHGLHGRSVAYATGIKLANPELKVLVLMGDGGCGIGGHHLLNAARRNIGVCVLVFNNLNFGMTGGQHSVTTPHGALTATTRAGNLERPLDICSTVAVNGAAYVYRGTSFDKDLSEHIAEAIDQKGFALLDIWELCTAYYAPHNDYSRTDMLRLLEALKFRTGLLQQADDPELSAACHEQAALVRGQSPFQRKPFVKQFDAQLLAPVRIVLAGAAGGKVKSTATALAHAAMRCGLWCTQRDDYPVTVMSGHSVSEVIIAPSEILYTGTPQPDILAVLTPEGLGQVKSQLAAMDESSRVYCVAELAERVQTRARKTVFKPLARRAHKKSSAMLVLAAILRDTQLIPLAALRESISAEQPAEIAAEQLWSVDHSIELL
jgi:pyruvate/2-oxoacid:ferredoxin oxidoreductase beta subunit/Pyruvate/2-oxoacid:ferredoxin oxidoreductase gamma subunit